MLCKALCIAILACLSSVVFADSPIETIPLKDIWASRMPGTLDVRDLEPRVYGADSKKLPSTQQQQAYESSLVKQIIVSLSEQSTDEVAQTGFVVPGVGATALDAACDFLVRHKAPPEINSNQEVSIVFFSRELNYYVHITGVERQSNVFRIHYEFVGHDTKDATVHFALIPVGKLPAGVYSVEMLRTQQAGEDQKLSVWEPRIVCKSFSFTVENQQDNQKKGVQP